MNRDLTRCMTMLLATTAAWPLMAQTGGTLPTAETAQTDAQASGTSAAGRTDDVVVTGVRQSMRNSAQIKKNTAEVVDSITSQDIGKLPDPNVAETLTRIPGVQGYRFGGESSSPAGAGSGLTIRGLSGQTAARLDGRAFFTAGQREFSLDNATAGVVAGLDVFKNPSAEHIEGAIGGLVDVRTNKPLDLKGPTFGIGATVRYNDLAKKYVPEFNVLASHHWDVGDGGELGILLAGSYQRSWNRSDNNPANGGANISRAIRADDPSFTTAGGGAAYAGRTDVWYLQNVANPLALSAADRQNLITTVTQVANTNQEDIERTRKGLNGTIQWKVNPTLELYLQGNYNYFQYHQRYRFINMTDSRTVQNLVTTPFNLDEALANRNSNGGTDELLAGRRLVSGTFLNSSLNTLGGGQYTINKTYLGAAGAKWHPTDHLEADFDLSYVKATSTIDNRSVQLSAAPGLTWNFTRNLDASPHDVTIDGPSLTSPANFYFDNYGNSTRNSAKDDGVAIRFDVKRSFDGGLLSSIRAGVRYATHTDDYKDYSYSGKFLTTNGLALAADRSNGIAATTAPELLALSATNWMDKKTFYTGSVLTFDPDALFGDNVRNRFAAAGIPADDSLPENLLNRRYFDEKTYAAYVVGDFRLLDDRIKGNAGVRVVRTDQFTRAQVADTSSGTRVIVPVGSNSSYTNVLPTANVTGYITQSLLLRLGYGKGIARPDFSALNPAIIVNTSTGTGSQGNANLQPVKADSYDISLEQYFHGGYVSADVFYKKIDGLFSGIENCITVPTALPYTGTTANSCPTGQYRVTQSVNALGGYSKGVELSTQTFFDFGFVPSILRQFGVSASYTHVLTKVPLVLNGLTVKTPQPFTSKNSYSVAGLYENKIVSARVVYTWRSPFVLFGVSANPIDGRYVNSYGILDASVSFNLPANFSVSIDASNLTNKGPDRYVGEPGNYETGLERQHFLNGRNFGVSVRYRFGG